MFTDRDRRPAVGGYRKSASGGKAFRSRCSLRR
jgi:hypothetical protein